jgi:hypothetical protein
MQRCKGFGVLLTYDPIVEIFATLFRQQLMELPRLCKCGSEIITTPYCNNSSRVLESNSFFILLGLKVVISVSCS